MGYAIVQGNTTEPLKFLMVSAADHITGLTGLTPTVTLNKGGSLTFAPPAGAVVELANGWYAVLPNATDADTLGPLVLHADAAGADPLDDTFDVQPGPTPAPGPPLPVVTAGRRASGGEGTFESVWRKVRLYVPTADVFLVRTWVQDAYNTVIDRKGWAWATVQGQITWEDARLALDVTVTRGSATVTAGAGTFSSADLGRQFRVGSFPIYTIAEVPSATAIVLDRPYAGTSGAVEADILDAWTAVAADVSRFQVLIDPINQRFVPWWATQEELAILDPSRTSTASVPRLLVALGTSQQPLTWGQMQYTFWPIPTAAGSLQYWAVEAPRALPDSYAFPGLLGRRTDVLEVGALVSAAKWPGTAQQPNPYFNLGLARQLQEDFNAALLQLDLRDDDQRPDSWTTLPWQRWNAYSWSYDPHLLQMTDATIGDYWGGGWLG